MYLTFMYNFWFIPLPRCRIKDCVPLPSLPFLVLSPEAHISQWDELQRKFKESSLSVKDHDALLQVNSRRCPSSSQILKKDLNQSQMGLWIIIALTVQQGLRSFLFFFRLGLCLILLVKMIIREEALVRMMLYYPKKSLGSADYFYFVLT